MHRKQLLELAQGFKAPYPKTASVVDVFERVVKKYPGRIALQFLEKTLTYRELNLRANKIARHLRKIGVKNNDLVGIGLEKSVDLFVGIVAILKAGAAYVPIDASYPMERKLYMIKDAKLRVFLTSSTLEKEFPAKKLTFVRLDEVDFSSYPSTDLGLTIRPLSVAYVNYTSGTTGKPKGVQLLHRGINRYIAAPHWIDILPTDRFLQICNLSFDGLTQELWGALLNGAALCIYPEVNFSPSELGTFLEKYQVTQAVLTSRLFTLMVEQSLSSLAGIRYLGVAGDVMSVKHAKIALEHLPSCQLMNEYGPTENTTCTTVYLIKTAQAIELGIPIGRPIGNTTAYVLDDQQQLVPFGAPGELCVGGDGLAKGYLRRPALTKEKFIRNPFGKGRLYRTGDLARYLPDGNLLFLGRIDTQVKIRGFRIELGEIEEIIRSHKDVADCAAIVTEKVTGDKRLIVYVEARRGKRLSPEELKSWVSLQVPPYMVPHFFVCVQELPMTPNGKVDRNSLPEIADRKKQSLAQTDTEKKLATIWSHLLHRKTISRDDHFFEIGGDSISAMQLSAEIEAQFQIVPSVRMIFENATLGQYAAHLDRQQKNRCMAVGDKVPFTVWREKEVVLDPAISAQNCCPVKKGQSTDPKSIFLTGATGFVGAFFLRELLEGTKGHVHCLVRARNEKEGWEKLIHIMKTYWLWKASYKKRISICVGSLEQPLLGLGEQAFQKLGEAVDTIFHIGAFVNHALPYEQHKGANVFGTHEALRLACTVNLKPFHFISSLAVLEGAQKKQIVEDVDLNQSSELLNGYIQSKWVAEKLTLLARERGIPCSIFRLPRVGGDSKTGSGPTGDFLWRLVQASILLKKAPEIEGTDDLTPVDYICKAILYISKKPAWNNSTFHVVSPYVFKYQEIFTYLKRFGYSLSWTHFSSWQKALVNKAQKTKNPRLQALSALLSESVWQQPLQELSFSTQKLEQALQGSSLRCPKIDEKLCKKYINYYIGTKFLPDIIVSVK